MTYELAKQLKDAGFPLKEDNCFSPECTCEISFDGSYLTPTLSELIEECGRGFKLERFDIYKRKTFWRATDVFTSAEGPTPEIAVAKLYIKIHEK